MVLRLLLSALALTLGLTMTMTLRHFARYGYVLKLEDGRWMVPAGIEPNMTVLYLDFLLFSSAVLLASGLIVYDLWQMIRGK